MNFETAKEEFLKYTSLFDQENDKIELKVSHTLSVVNFSENIAKSLKLSKEDIELSKIIGLLHDIGRFEQVAQYDSFSDLKTVDHAELGVQVLLKDNLIRKFIKTNKYDEIIIKSVLNHNKYSIEQGLSDKELLHCKIVRDADKTDLFKIRARSNFKELLKIKENEDAYQLNDEVFNDFMSHKSILNSKANTYLEKTVLSIAFIYDYNFNYGLKYIKDNNYIDIILSEIKNNDKIEAIKKRALDYIDKRLNQ